MGGPRLAGVLLLAIGSVYVVGVARLLIWRIAPDSRRMTIGMLAIAAASTLYLRHIGEMIIDPRDWFGDNLSDLGQHLLTLLACFEFGAASLQTAWGERPLKYWRLGASLAAIGLLVTYRIGDEWSTPSEEFELTDTASLIHDWIVLGALTITFTLVGFVARRTMRLAGHRAGSMIGMYAVGVLGTSCPIMIAALLIIKPVWVHNEYHQLSSGWTAVALFALAAAAGAGLLTTWRERDDPHPRR